MADAVRHPRHLLPVHRDLSALQQPENLTSVVYSQALGTGGRDMVLEAIAPGQLSLHLVI